MMRQIKQYSKLLLVCLWILGESLSEGNAQENQDQFTNFSLIGDAICSKIDFCIDSLSLISGPEESYLSFVSAIHRLQEGKDTVVSIVHLGDSHIQAGFLTGKTMRLLQQEYGNAGRGWIAPFKLSKTNEPFDYFISSNVKEWVAGRMTQGIQKTAVGPGGIGIESAVSDIRLNIGVTPRNGVGYSFNQVLVYRDARSMSVEVTGRLKDSIDVQYGFTPVIPGVLRDTFRINCPVDTLLLRTTRTDLRTGEHIPSADFKNIYYGFELRNGASGILYHSIGINGAMFVNYTNEEFIERLSLLEPALLIVSLGTNETFARRFSEAEFTGQVQAFVEMIQQYMPSVSLLLTTPPECYRPVTINKKREYVRNEKTALAAKVIAEIAEKNGVACWDLFSFTGGPGSCEKWFKGKWMGKDRIHFNQAGYEEQGILFYQAIRELIDN